MQLSITGRHITLTPALKTYAEEKIMTLMSRLATDPKVAQGMHVDIEVARETAHHHKGEIWKAATTIILPGGKHPLHASAHHKDMYAAIDLLVEEIEHELQYAKGRVRATLLRSARAFKRVFRFTPESQAPGRERVRDERS